VTDQLKGIPIDQVAESLGLKRAGVEEPLEVYVKGQGKK